MIDNLRITNIPIQHQSKLLSLSFEFDVKENGFVEIKVWKNDEEYTDLGSKKLEIDLNDMETLFDEMKEHFDIFLDYLHDN